MSEYKAPILRRALKSKVKSLLLEWINENLDDTGDTSTPWDDADDWAARKYQDEIEDGKSHSAAMKEAKASFYEVLRESLETQVQDAFESLGE